MAIYSTDHLAKYRKLSRTILQDVVVSSLHNDRHVQRSALLRLDLAIDEPGEVRLGGSSELFQWYAVSFGQVRGNGG